MLLVRSIGVLALVLLLVPSAASGQLGSFRPRPLSNYWQFDVRPMSGEVQSIETTMEATGRRGASPPAITTFHTTAGGGLQMRMREAMVDFDAKGRVVKVTSVTRHSTGQGERLQSFILTEVATYDADGVLTEVQRQRGDESPSKLAIASEARDGGRLYTWKYPFMDSEWVGELTLNKDGRLVKWESNPPGFNGNPPWTFAHNDRGDITEVAMGTSSKDLYTYVYDEKGNWIERTRTTVRGDETKPQETYRRKITYGAPTPEPKTPPGFVVVVSRAGAAGAPAAKAPMPDAPPPPPQAGARIYRFETETPGERGRFFNQMTIVLNPDKSAALTTVTEFNQTTTRKTAVGDWSEGANVIAVNLVKASDGTALPRPLELKFDRNEKDELHDPRNPGTVFKRVKAEEK